MAGTEPGDLYALASEYLAACVEALDTIPVFDPTLAGAPERSFISPGLPVWDCCEQLTVHVDGVSEDVNSLTGSGRHASLGRLNIVGFVTTVTRCIPVVGGTQLDAIPEVEDLSEAARQIHADGWALWNHIYNMVRAGELFALCDEVFYDGLRAAAPMGGCGGWTMTVHAQLDGYEES